MFESRISCGAMEKQPVSGKSDANVSSWSYDMEGHANKCVERYCEMAKQNNEKNSRKSQHHALTTTNSKKKKWDLLENCLKFA